MSKSPSASPSASPSPSSSPSLSASPSASVSPSPSPEHISGVEYGIEGVRFRDTYTAVRVGRTIVVDAILPSRFAIQVKGSPDPLSSWTVTLEGSLDGTNFTTLLTHNSGDGSVVFMADSASPKPVRYLRVNVSALTLGPATSALVNVVAKA